MDTFRIEYAFDKTDFIEENLIRWEVNGLRNRKQIRNYSIISIIILALGLVIITEEEPTNPFIYIGSVYLVCTAALVFLRLVSKNKFTEKVKKIAENYELQNMNCIYELSNESIKYWDKQKHIDFKWEVFTSYNIYKGYLILNIESSLIDLYIFKENESEIDCYKKVLEFAKSKLELKEIK